MKTRHIFHFLLNTTLDLIFHPSLFFFQLTFQQPAKFVPTFSWCTSLILKEEFHCTKKTSYWGDENSSNNHVCARMKYHFECTPLYIRSLPTAQTIRTVCVVWHFIFLLMQKDNQKDKQKNYNPNYYHVSL